MADTSKLYFTKETEQAIIRYNQETDHPTRSQLFEEQIYPAFDKLVENIFNTFKFEYMETGYDTVHREALSHLVTMMHQFAEDWLWAISQRIYGS